MCNLDADMAKRGLPSCAEVSDAALGVRAECIMLNKGPYIVETVRFLAEPLERMGEHCRKQRPMLCQMVRGRKMEDCTGWVLPTHSGIQSTV